MRKSVYFILLCLFVLAGAFCFTSCAGEVFEIFRLKLNSTVENPQTTDSTLLLANGDVLAFTLELDKEKSSEDLRITSVKFSFDGEEVASANSSPFSLNYPIQGMSVDSEHTFSWEAKIKDDDDFSTTESEAYKVKILKETFSADLVLSFGENVDSISATTVSIKRGEQFTCCEGSLDNNVGAQVKSVSYSWDGTSLLTTAVSPFSLSYDTANISTGTHKLAYAYTIETYYGNCELSNEIYVIVE